MDTVTLERQFYRLSLKLMSLLRILYIDSDPHLASQVLEYFNPPSGMPEELILRRNKELPEKDKYEYFFHFVPTFERALEVLLLHNFDPVGKARGLEPFDTIFVEVRRKNKLDKYSWQDFLKRVNSIGLNLLGLTQGFLGYGPEIDGSVREQLANLGVRYYLSKPFSFERLRSILKEYSFHARGSHYIKVEEREKEDNPLVRRRVLRFYNIEGKLEAVELSQIYASQEQRELDYKISR
jgi:hypothetical protein